MVISCERLADRAVKLYIQGKLDVNNAPLLRREIAAIGGDVTRLVLDFRDVIYVTSAGLRELIVCRKRFSGPEAMLIENVSQDVYDIFEDVGFASAIPMRLMEADVSTYLSLSFKDFLKRKAAEDGGRVVVSESGGDYTWADIEKGAQLIADDLAALGVTKRTHVGLCGANSANWIMAFYGIQKLGAIAMLINPKQFSHEIARTAVIGDITHLCYGEMAEMQGDEQAFLKKLQDEGAPVKAFYSIRSHVDMRSRFPDYEGVKDKFQQSVEPDDICTVIFTSGSTGRPKGVMLSSYNILNAAVVSCEDQTLTPQDRSCLILPLFHIFGLVAGLFANAIAGSTLYLPKDIHIATLLELIAQKRCTFFHSVPTMLIALLNHREFDPKKCATLRCTIISGAAATQAQIEMFQRKLPNDHFLAAYGLSEMAPVSMTLYEDTREHVLHTVGRPVRNISVKIQDVETKADLPIGQTGEILVQGFNLMSGYYKVPVEDQAIDEEGWLHTGDLGSMNGEGYLCISGRLKDLIIRGGENIMPGEVEAAISELPMVDQVKVVGMPSSFYGEEVGACIVLKDGHAFDEPAVKAALSTRLARYKVPSHYMLFDRFPMLGSGKIDAVALKQAAIARVALDR